MKTLQDPYHCFYLTQEKKLKFGRVGDSHQLGREDPRAKPSCVRLYSPVLLHYLVSLAKHSLRLFFCCSSVSANIPPMSLFAGSENLKAMFGLSRVTKFLLGSLSVQFILGLWKA